MMMQRRPFQRGVSLIEALVAMAVMAFGMLGIIGVQSTLRFNSDVAKQRSEAVRLAQQVIEQARSFTSIEAVSQPDYSDIISGTVSSSYASSQTNTTYLIDSDVTPSGDTPDLETPRAKRLRVTVRWADRTNSNPALNSTNQSVVMDTVIAKVMPELGGMLALSNGVSLNGVTVRGPSGRNIAVPTVGVTDNGNGTSSFTPPGTTGVTWIFDNTTALIKIVGDPFCSTGQCMLLRGYIIFSTGGVPDSENPMGGSPSTSLSVTVNQKIPVPNTSPVQYTLRTVSCYVDSVSSSTGYGYYCALAPTSSAPVSWSGQSVLGGLSISSLIGVSISDYRVCRYTPQRGTDPVTGLELGDFPANGNSGHPFQYDQVTSALINQNFLVISAGNGGGSTYNCPADNLSTPFINGNTWQHQPHS